MVNATPYEDGDFPQAHTLAAAMNHWNQMQSPSIVLPPAADRPCEIDRIRPAPTPLTRKGAADRPENERRMWVSSACGVRRGYGIDEKHNFYSHRVANLRYSDFTNDLEEIADYSKAGKLNRKIALIYLDGNRFGSILRACQTDKLATKWSQLVRGHQDEFLRWLLGAGTKGQLGKAAGFCRKWC